MVGQRYASGIARNCWLARQAADAASPAVISDETTIRPADRLARRRHPCAVPLFATCSPCAPSAHLLAGGLPACELFDSEVFSTLAADLLAHSPQQALQYRDRRPAASAGGRPGSGEGPRRRAPPPDPLITTGSQQAASICWRAPSSSRAIR
jgi:DNA-binding transcriptional MocR family regulator